MVKQDPNLWNRRARPHWLYRFFDEYGSLLYVGLTSNPPARMRGWFSDGRYHAEWFSTVRRVDWQRYMDWHLGEEAERDAIKSERPIYNNHHRPRERVA